jgi:hypothetical protein
MGDEGSEIEARKSSVSFVNFLLEHVARGGGGGGGGAGPAARGVRTRAFLVLQLAAPT